MAAACKHMVASTETLGKLAQMHLDSAERKTPRWDTVTFGT